MTTLKVRLVGIQIFLWLVLLLFIMSACQLQPASSIEDQRTPSVPFSVDKRNANNEAENLPAINRSFLFLADGKLQLWNHNIDDIEILIASNITKYSSTQYGQRLIVAQQDSLDLSRHNLIMLDLVDRSTQTIVEKIPCLHDFALSPDGRYLLYIADEWDSEKQACKTSLAIEGQEIGVYSTFSNFLSPHAYRLGGTIYILDIVDIDDSLTTTSIGYCNSIIRENATLSQFLLCPRAYWSPDSQNIVWFDADGVWLVNLESKQPVMIRSLFNSGDDHLYTTVEWSPSGKYLMVRGNSLSGEGAKRLILQWQTGKEIIAPYADYFVIGIRPDVIWLHDDRLFFTKPMATAEIWEVLDNENILVKEQSLELAPNDSEYIATSLHQLSNGSLAYVLVSPYQENKRHHGLYLVSDLNRKPQKIATLPLIENYTSDIRVFWSNDESEVVVEYWNHLDTGHSERVYYHVLIPLGSLLNLTPLLGKGARFVQWLP